MPSVLERLCTSFNPRLSSTSSISALITSSICPLGVEAFLLSGFKQLPPVTRQHHYSYRDFDMNLRRCWNFPLLLPLWCIRWRHAMINVAAARRTVIVLKSKVWRSCLAESWWVNDGQDEVWLERETDDLNRAGIASWWWDKAGFPNNRNVRWQLAICESLYSAFDSVS